MAMYECRNCGGEESTWAEVLVFPVGKDRFHLQFEKFYAEAERELLAERGYTVPPERDVNERAWEKLYRWMGNNTPWFCSVECAVEYLQKGEFN